MEISTELTFTGIDKYQRCAQHKWLAFLSNKWFSKHGKEINVLSHGSMIKNKHSSQTYKDTQKAFIITKPFHMLNKHSLKAHFNNTFYIYSCKLYTDMHYRAQRS